MMNGRDPARFLKIGLSGYVYTHVSKARETLLIAETVPKSRNSKQLNKLETTRDRDCVAVWRLRKR